MSEECPFHLKTVSKMEPLEYRSLVKFLNMQGKSPSVIFEEIFSVYQEECPSYETVKYWVRKFKSGFLSIHERVEPSCGKVLLFCFWDRDGIIMTDYLEHGHTITGNYYSALLAKLRSTLAKKRRGKLQKGILLLHDNTPAHRSKMAVHKSMQWGFKILPHPSYSPDLAPSDFFLFPSLKKHLKGQRFHSNKDVIFAVEEWFESHPKSYYAQGLVKVKERWQKCVDMQGDYVEK